MYTTFLLNPVARWARAVAVAGALLAPTVGQAQTSALLNGRAEAESGQLNGVTVATTPAGFSGTGFVTGFDNSDAKNVVISFNNPTTGLYKLTVGYRSPFGFKKGDVTVNGTKSTVTFTGTTDAAPFGTSDAGNFLLSNGLNTITIGGNYGYYGIDYIQIAPVSVAPPSKPAKLLSDPLATPTAKALHAYLVDLYGTKILSGQQDDQYGRSGSEIGYVLAHTGKEPAIASMDLLNYASSAVARYGTPADAERYLNLGDERQRPRHHKPDLALARPYRFGHVQKPKRRPSRGFLHRKHLVQPRRHSGRHRRHPLQAADWRHRPDCRPA